MKRKRIITGIIISTLLLLVTAGIIMLIDYDMSHERVMVDLYFLNSDGTGIVAEQHEIKYKTDADLARNTVKKLSAAPKDSRKERIIPRSAQINQIDLYEDKIVIDFSHEFITEDPVRNVLEVYAVVKTLCSTGLAAAVTVTADGVPVTDRDGNALLCISASDINLENEEYSSEMRDIVLYFADKNEEGLIREERRIKITDQQPVEQYIINELIKGTQNKNIESLLSNKTVLVSVDIEDNICYLNFKSEFIKENSGSKNHEQLVIYSVVNSLTELGSINRVQFYMDGKRVDNFGSVPIKDCISRDTTMIK